MNHVHSLPDRLREAFIPGPRGVVGLVDDLLRLCDEQGLSLSWDAGRCHVRSPGSRSDRLTEIPLPGSVFRAALARFAVLCNENVPGSVSPYGGEGRLSIASLYPAIFRIEFTNTAAEQRLELRRVAPHPNGETAGDASIRNAPVRPR